MQAQEAIKAAQRPNSFINIKKSSNCDVELVHSSMVITDLDIGISCLHNCPVIEETFLC